MHQAPAHEAPYSYFFTTAISTASKSPTITPHRPKARADMLGNHVVLKEQGGGRFMPIEEILGGDIGEERSGEGLWVSTMVQVLASEAEGGSSSASEIAILRGKKFLRVFSAKYRDGHVDKTVIKRSTPKNDGDATDMDEFGFVHLSVLKHGPDLPVPPRARSRARGRAQSSRHNMEEPAAADAEEPSVEEPSVEEPSAEEPSVAAPIAPLAGFRFPVVALRCNLTSALSAVSSSDVPRVAARVAPLTALPVSGLEAHTLPRAETMAPARAAGSMPLLAPPMPFYHGIQPSPTDELGVLRPALGIGTVPGPAQDDEDDELGTTSEDVDQWLNESIMDDIGDDGDGGAVGPSSGDGACAMQISGSELVADLRQAWAMDDA